jgi:hypothetical protein
VDCGIIGNISITKGDAGWSEAGLPLSIDIGIDVEDIYPQLVIANNASILNLNFSLAAYLDSMTGISYVESLTGGSIKHGLRNLLAAVASGPRKYMNEKENEVIGFVQNINSWFAQKVS